MTNTTQQTDEPDQYAKLCRAMEEGLIITINGSHHARGRGSDVLHVTSGGDEVTLTDAYHTRQYSLRQNDEGDTVLVEFTDDGYEDGRTYVETIEILGIETPD